MSQDELAYLTLFQQILVSGAEKTRVKNNWITFLKSSFL